MPYMKALTWTSPASCGGLIEGAASCLDNIFLLRPPPPRAGASLKGAKAVFRLRLRLTSPASCGGLIEGVRVSQPG